MDFVILEHMFDVLDELEAVIDKVAAFEGVVDVGRVCVLVERLEFVKLRAIGEYDRSGDWALESYASTASALRSKCRTSHGSARRSIRLARKLESLSATAAAFSAGKISREHAEVIARAATPARAEMIAGIEAEVVEYARLATPGRLADAVRRMTDAFDGDGGAAADERQHRLNDVTFAEVGGRGILNGTLDPETSKLADAAFNTEMETLRRPNDTRLVGERRAEAFEAMCRRTLDHHDDGTRRRRGQPHLLVVQDLAELSGAHPQLVADIRAEASRFGRLSRTTLERLSCDCKVSRVLTDGPSQILDVGRLTRTVTGPLWAALVARDQHCTEAGCDRPPDQCEAHHIKHWSHGGPTNLDNLKLGCRQHHREWHLREAHQSK